ncbi:helix-turn-helix domain-containing protein [uncultured Phascolarctobacterium sp.]|uniref:helix-turn-helix domain-containing protein n=1 Tax=uncultured Phascolarctobacterium sp. TaxID=512296 RepID=UPI0025D05E6D|nr:helix-turn-helix transcriptional regulator [uncultured Phascolarctobacterium sp.]
MNIKDIIKQKRLECGYTMKELAEKVGVSEATVSRWESGNLATMKHTKIMLLAKALKISPAMLFDAPASPSFSLTQQEETHIKKYRQLDADGKEEIDDIIDVKLAKLQRKAEEDVESLG